MFGVTMTTIKASRWLDLLAYLLQYHYGVTREQIYEHVAEYRRERELSANEESLRRKFERDKDELRALGITIETVPMPGAEGDEPQRGYRLRPAGFYLPLLELDAAASSSPPYRGLERIHVTKADVAALDRATRRVEESGSPVLAAAAASARRKLGFDVPLPLAAVERVLARPLGAEGQRSLETLQRAVAERVAVRCRYFSISRDVEEERVIEPYGLYFNWGRWYCVARSREKAAMRVFRVDRMREAEVLKGMGSAFTVPADFSVRAYVHRAPWDLSEREPVRAVVRFAFPESRWVLAQSLGDPVTEIREDGGADIAFAVRDAHPFLRWLLTFRDAAQVMEPARIGAELAQLRKKVAALYAKDLRA
jgi:proteasome accessory factor B